MDSTPQMMSLRIVPTSKKTTWPTTGRCHLNLPRSTFPSRDSSSSLLPPVSLHPSRSATTHIRQTKQRPLLLLLALYAVNQRQSPRLLLPCAPHKSVKAKQGELELFLPPHVVQQCQLEVSLPVHAAQQCQLEVSLHAHAATKSVQDMQGQLEVSLLQCASHNSVKAKLLPVGSVDECPGFNGPTRLPTGTANVACH